MITSIILSFMHFLNASGIRGVEVQVIRPMNEDRLGVAFSGAVFSGLDAMHGVLENGVFLKPSVGSKSPNHADQSFGYYMGYTFIPNFPLIRPGVFVGVNYDKWQGEEGLNWKISPNYGVKAQVSILSFSFSGRGMGLGLNFGI